MVRNPPQSRTPRRTRFSKMLVFLIEALPLPILAMIFGLLDVPAQPFNRWALWFLFAPLASWHWFNFVIGVVFVVGLGAISGTDLRRKRALLALLIGVPTVMGVAFAVAILDRPSLTPAALTLGIAASSAFWALGSNRHRTR